MRLIVLLCLLAAHVNGYSQAKNFECPCSRLGIDSLWADSSRVSCYLIPVSRNAAEPSAGKFQLAVIKAAPLNTASERPLLYLHGGPGIATLDNLTRYLKSPTWNRLRQDRPLIFFDYRGTGFSEPSLCPGASDSLAAAYGKNLSPEEMQAYRVKLFSQCRTRHEAEGIEISTFNTFQLAEDAESIRQALEIGSWNVYGVSHGTTVALNLLRNHGEHINSMILDSPFPPNAPWPDFVRPFATSFKVLEEKIGEDPVARAHFPDLRNDFVKAVKRLNENPFRIVIDDKGSTYPFTGDDFAWSIWRALLKPSAIPFAPLAIREVANGNDSILTKWVMSFSDPNAFGRFSDYQSRAILCYEGKPKTASDTKESLLKEYPEFASFNLDFEDDICNAWQPASAGKETFAPVTSNVPVLILSGEYDPVCPPLFGEITSKTLSHSIFITVPAASHAAIHADDCMRDIATSFLSAPGEKPAVDCVGNRPGIKFITGNLLEALANTK